MGGSQEIMWQITGVEETISMQTFWWDTLVVGCSSRMITREISWETLLQDTVGYTFRIFLDTAGICWETDGAAAQLGDGAGAVPSSHPETDSRSRGTIRHDKNMEEIGLV